MTLSTKYGWTMNGQTDRDRKTRDKHAHSLFRALSYNFLQFFLQFFLQSLSLSLSLTLSLFRALALSLPVTQSNLNNRCIILKSQKIMLLTFYSPSWAYYNVTIDLSLSLFLCFNPYARLSVCLLICLSQRLGFICQYICLTALISLSVCLSVYLSVCQY